MRAWLAFGCHFDGPAAVASPPRRAGGMAASGSARRSGWPLSGSCQGLAQRRHRPRSGPARRL